MAYVTPSLMKVGKEDHLVMMTATLGRGRNAGGGNVKGIDPFSGKKLQYFRPTWRSGEGCVDQTDVRISLREIAV